MLMKCVVDIVQHAVSATHAILSGPGASTAVCPGPLFHFSSACAWPWILLIQILIPGLTSQVYLGPALSPDVYWADPGYQQWT